MDGTACCLRITVSEDRIGDTTVQLANSDWETDWLFGFHQILHRDVLKFVMKWHGGEQPDLPQVVTDGPDEWRWQTLAGKDE